MFIEIITMSLSGVVKGHDNKGKTEAHEEFEVHPMPFLSVGLTSPSDGGHSFQISADAQSGSREGNSHTDCDLRSC